jgi:predicted permease
MRLRYLARNLLRKGRVEQELALELQSYLSLLIDQNLQSGMTAEDARRAALLQMEGLEAVKERVRDVRGGALLESIGRDLRYGLRVLIKTPAFFATAVGILALGIGIATTVFCVAEAQLWRPLPFSAPDRLVFLSERNLKRTWLQIPAAVANFADWRQNAHSFESLAAIRWPEEHNFSIPGFAARPRVGLVSANFLKTFRIEPEAGRAFRPSEEQPGNNHEAILSDGMARQAFGSAREAVGKTVKLDGDPYTVVGVLRNSFKLEVIRTPDVFTPLDVVGNTDREDRVLAVIGRLTSGVSDDQAQTEMKLIASRLAAGYPADANWSVRVENLRTAFTRFYRAPLFLYLGFSFFVLFIACANIAGLQLVRFAGRRREFAIREALGAGRVILFRQTLIESAWIALGGAFLGSLLAIWGVRGIQALPIAGSLPRDSEISLDCWALLFAVSASIAATLLFGLIPARSSSQRNIEANLRDSQRAVSGSAAAQRRIHWLVGAQVALAFVSVFGAGLFLRTHWALRQISLGFDSQDLLTVHISLSGKLYSDKAKRAAFFARVSNEAERIASVRESGLATGLPLSGAADVNFTRAHGRVPSQDENVNSLDRIVTPGYFRLMSIPLLRGRDFTSRDSALSPRVAIVNRNFARHVFGEEDPIGKELTIRPGGDDAVPIGQVQIIGVAANTKEVGLNEVDFNDIYLPFAQNVPHSAFVLLKTGAMTAAAPVLRRRLQKLDPEEFVAPPRSMDSYVTEAFHEDRGELMLAGILAGLAIALALLGVYGAISFAVVQRAREFGLRIALGAAPAEMLRLTLIRTCRLAVSGMACGIAAALILGELLRKALYLAPHEHEGMLYGISIYDPLSLSFSAALILLLAFLTGVVPAVRASSVDPCNALRHE